MTTLICDCNQTMPLMAKALGEALHEDLTLHSTLCRREAGAFQKALLSGDDLVVACTQEKRLFLELAGQTEGAKEYLKGNRYADFAEKAKMLNAAGLAQLRAEFTEIPPQVYANLLKNTADKATPAGSAERLKPKLDALLKALAGERGGNSPRASKAQAL